MVPYITTTELRVNPYYSMYYINIARLLILGVIPMSLLAYFNCMICAKIQPSSTISEQDERRHLRSTQRKRPQKVLIGIVVMYICCHALRIFINGYETVVIWDATACQAAGEHDFPMWSFIAITLSELLLVLNSSINMIIYCCLNGTFKRRLAIFKYHIEEDSPKPALVRKKKKSRRNEALQMRRVSFAT